MTSLNVIALISGGKDSFYSILHLLHHGHNLVAIANLHPEDEDNLDTESMMYQTIGHNVIPLYNKALGEHGQSLYRYRIRGDALCQESDYQFTSKDETESIREMLCLIINNHPEANAVSTGAIMSDYQRTRVESVAARLKLTSLAFLWQYPLLPPPPEREDSVSGLLDDMSAVGCDSRIIKTAHGNFDESLIGLNVADRKTISRLTTLARRWIAHNERELRASILGEGGEYETLTVDGPWSLWKWRIAVTDKDFEIFKRDGETIYACLPDPILEKKPISTEDQQPKLRIPSQLDSQFVAVDAAVRGDSMLDLDRLMGRVNLVSVQSTGYIPVRNLPVLEVHTEHHIAVSNLQCRVSVKEFTARIDTLFQRCSALCQRSEENPLGVRDVTFVMLQLSSMRDFAEVNDWYRQYFDVVNPPARVTISTRIPASARFSISLIIDLRDSRVRRGLHVQSRSYWAPANIGPYSQAIAEPLNTPHGKKPSMTYDGEPELVHMAGQIPLVPQTMKIYSRPFLDQAVLSLQHLWRVGQERGVDLWTCGVAFLQSHPESPLRARVAIKVWQKAHASATRPKKDDMEDVDPWDAQRNFSFASQRAEIMSGQGDHLHNLPNLGAYESEQPSQIAPPCIVAEVLALPAEAPIEWWSTGLANLPMNSPRVGSAGGREETIDANILAVRSLKYFGRVDGEGTLDNDGTQFFTLALLADHDGTAALLRDTLARMIRWKYDDGNPVRRIVSGTCFVAGDRGHDVYEEIHRDDAMKGLTVIACRRLFIDDAQREHGESDAHEAILAMHLRIEEWDKEDYVNAVYQQAHREDREKRIADKNDPQLLPLVAASPGPPSTATASSKAPSSHASSRPHPEHFMMELEDAPEPPLETDATAREHAAQFGHIGGQFQSQQTQAVPAENDGEDRQHSGQTPTKAAGVTVTEEENETSEMYG